MKLTRLLSILILAALIVLFILWKSAPSLISQKLSKKAEVEVKIDDIKLGTKSVAVDGISIGNPKNSVLAKALSVGSIEVDAAPTSFFGDSIVIDKIELDNVYFGLEFATPASGAGNWATILGNLKKGSETKPVETRKSENKKPTNILIKKLIITNITGDLVFFKVGGQATHITPIARLEFDNVSSSNGVSIDQIANLILNKALESVLEKENLQGVMQGVIQSPGSALERFTAPFKDLIPK